MVHENTFYGFLAQSRKCLTSWADHIAAWMSFWGRISKSILYVFLSFKNELALPDKMANLSRNRRFYSFSRCYLKRPFKRLNWAWVFVCIGQAELKQKVGKRCQTPKVWDTPEDQTLCVYLCELACLYTCSYKWLLAVYCVCSFSVTRSTPALSVCHGKITEWIQCVVLCVLASVCWFDRGVETPSANCDTAVAI